MDVRKAGRPSHCVFHDRISRPPGSRGILTCARKAHAQDQEQERARARPAGPHLTLPPAPGRGKPSSGSGTLGRGKPLLPPGLPGCMSSKGSNGDVLLRALGWSSRACLEAPISFIRRERSSCPGCTLRDCRIEKRAAIESPFLRSARPSRRWMRPSEGLISVALR